MHACRDVAMAPFFGNSVACRIAEAHEIKHSTLVLGDWRAAQRVEFYIGPEEENGQQHEQEGQWRRQPPGGHVRRSNRLRDGGAGKLASASAAASNSSDGDGNSGEAGGDAIQGQHHVLNGKGNFKIWVVNTHLDHEHQDNRQRQVCRSQHLQSCTA